MTQDGIWLGRARGPVRLVMILSMLAALGLGLALAIGSYGFGSGVTMHDILRPGDKLLVRLEVWAIGLAVLSLAILLSDIRAGIETAPKGPLDLLSLILSRIAMVLVVVLVLVMLFEVVARYVFEKPTIWANEMSLWFAGFIYLLSGLYAMQQRSHIRIHTVYDLMPRGLRKAADAFGVLLVWAFAAALVWGGFNEAWDKLLRWETFGTAWDPPLPATVKPAILLVIVIVALQSLSNLILDWNKPPEHHSADEIDPEEIEMLRRNLEAK